MTYRRSRWLALVVIFVVICWGTPFVLSAPRLSVTAGKTALRNLPVRLTLPESLRSGPLRLRDAKSGKHVPSQRDGDRLVWILAALEPGRTREFVLEKEEPPKSAREDTVQLQRIGADLNILVGGKPLMRYVTKGAGRPYCWPVHGPSGQPVTRGYPMKKGVPGEKEDHLHHRSFWFGYDKVNGHDFWRYGKATMVHKEFLSTVSGPVFGEFTARVDWLSEAGKKVCEDVRRLRVWNVSGARLMDCDVEMRASEGAVQLGDSEEGMFAFRVAGSMKVESGGTLLNANGDRNNDTWGKRAPWCDYSGPVGGEVVGIAVFDDPGNLRHPTYWHVRPYGLFCANRFGVNDFTDEGDGSYHIDEGKSLIQRFRVYIHDGNAEEAHVADHYAAFAEPPKVVLRRDSSNG